MLDVIDPGLPGVEAGFTTRAGGTSVAPWDSLNLGGHVGDAPDRVEANRGALAAALGSGPVVFPDQVHGAGVLVVDATDQAGSPRLAGIDALVTTVAGRPLGVLVADCLPVVLADPRHGVVGVAHAGRKGLAAGVLQRTVETMTSLGADPASMSAVIGPAICGRCYEVPAELREEVDSTVPGSASETRQKTPSLDLPAGAVGVLRAAGVTDVRCLGWCTAEDEQLFSYRRDGVTGRFAGFVMLRQVRDGG